MTIPRVFIDYTGDIESALFLSQLLYWTGKSDDGWIYKTYAQWQAEIFIKEKKARSIKDSLETMGIIESKVKRVSGIATVHYKVLQHRLIENLLERYGAREEKAAPERPKLPNRNGQNDRTGTDEKAVPTITKTIYIDYKHIYPGLSLKMIEMIVKVINYLNEAAGTNIPTGENGRAPAKAYIKAIVARIRNGGTLEQFKKIIDFKTTQWKHDIKMRQYLNPETLFRDSNFDKYIQQADAMAAEVTAARAEAEDVLAKLFPEEAC